MYRVLNNKLLEKINETSFGEIHWKERQDLQECIVAQPSILGEELLIIQKEFSGFDSTSERLDLLALDKQGRLVIIENKLDDTGRDVVWQAVKYASYCSSLQKDEITKIFENYIQKNNLKIDAEQTIVDFLNVESLDVATLNPGYSQRIIFVAREFRKEVLSAAQWLMNFDVNISCIKIVPLKSGNDIFLDSRKLLPVEETKDYILKLADKAKSARKFVEMRTTSKRILGRIYSVFQQKQRTF